MVNEFYFKGHHYQVTPIEGCDDFTIVKDGKFARRVKKEIAEKAMENADRLFK